MVPALPTAGDLSVSNPDDMQAKLQLLTRTGLLQCYEKGAVPIFMIRPGRHLAAAYYRNTIVHYFLSGALAEVALAAARFDPTGRSFRAAVLQLRDLLKFEFSSSRNRHSERMHWSFSTIVTRAGGARSRRFRKVRDRYSGRAFCGRLSRPTASWPNCS